MEVCVHGSVCREMQKESEFIDMSKIWAAIREAERDKNARLYNEGPEDGSDLIPDRRSTKRLTANTPVLVYGYGSMDDPFHEGTEALSVNARGGLITLTTTVNPGQTLLLINKTNEREERCTVVREVSTYLNRTGIAVKFPEPVTDFWDAEPR
jgi:hypothetical protein